MKGRNVAVRTITFFLIALLAVQLFASPAWGLLDDFSDANDVEGRFDIKRAFISVSGSPNIAVFSLITYGRWRARHLLDPLTVLKADFDSRGGRAVDYFVLIDTVDRNTITCDLYRRRGRDLVESGEATKGSRFVTCHFTWWKIHPTRRVRWRELASNVNQLDLAPDEGFSTIS